MLRVPLIVSLGRGRGSTVAATRRTLLVSSIVTLRRGTAKAAGRALVVLRSGLVSALVVPASLVGGLLLRRLPPSRWRRLVEALHARRDGRRSLFVNVELSPGVLAARAKALLPRLKSLARVPSTILITYHLARKQILAGVEHLSAGLDA